MNMTVNNLQKCKDWYRDIFDFKEVESGLAENKKDGKSRPWSILKKDDAMLCLYEEENRSPQNDIPDTFHQIYHYGIRIDECEIGDWEDRIKNFDLKLYYGGTAIEYPHSTSWYIKDPAGYVIEVSYWPNGYKF